MKDWTTSFARMTYFSRQAFDDPPIAQEIQRQTVAELVDGLARHGWNEEARASRYGPKIDLLLSRSHAGFETRNLVALLVEARALDLLTPNPFPEVVLWPWLARLERWWST